MPDFNIKFLPNSFEFQDLTSIQVNELFSPTNLQIESLSITSIKLTWEYVHTEVDSFVLEKSTDNVTWSIINLENGTLREYIYTELNVNTEYFFRIKAVENNQDQPYSATVSKLILNPFIFTVDTTRPGTSDNNSFTLPLTDFGTYDLFVKTEDGVEHITAFDDPAVTHTFSTFGIKTYEIWGDYSGFQFNNLGDKSKIQNVLKWGDLNIAKNSVFYGCNNLTSSATDAPTISSTDLSEMFRSASLFNGDISTWDVSKVTSMYRMFFKASTFNQNLNNWNVSNVTNMSEMFREATSFNGDISSWNVSNVTNMSEMFSSASTFNQNLNNWNVSNVTNMSLMFHSASAFNQNLNTWNVANVTSMSLMFFQTSLFNQDISSWNVSIVTNMSGMFRGATSFNQDISSWNVANVTNMFGMFREALAFNQSLAGWGNHLVAGRLGGVPNMTQFLDLCGMNTANYDATLIAWAAVDLIDSIRIGVGGRTYNAAGAGGTARANIITNDSWTFVGDVAA